MPPTLYAYVTLVNVNAFMLYAKRAGKPPAAHMRRDMIVNLISIIKLYLFSVVVRHQLPLVSAADGFTICLKSKPIGRRNTSLELNKVP